MQVLIAVEAVRFPMIPDDGINGKSELLFSLVALSKAGQAQLEATATLDLEASNGLWDLNIANQLGFECTPASPITLTYSLVELDNGSKEVAGAILFTLARAAALYFWNPTFALTHLATGVVSSMLLPVINGNDDLGSGQTVLDPSKGDQLLEIKGPDGEAQVHLRTIVNEVADTGQCSAPKKETPGREPTGEPETSEPPSRKEISRIYQPLHDTYWKISEIQGERGTRRLSRSELDRVRRTYMSLMLRSAGTVALQYIMVATWEGKDPGKVREAWDHFLRGERYAQAAMRARGQEARDVNMDRALTAYERACEAAVRALVISARDETRSLAVLAGAPRTPFQWAGVGSAPPVNSFGWAAAQNNASFEIPLYLFFLPDYLAVKEGSDLGIVAFAPGADDGVEVSISGAPAGMEAQVEPLGEASCSFLVRIAIGNVSPGSYRLTITVVEGGDSISRELTLVVEK